MNMEEKLELKHLAPYLPHGLKMYKDGKTVLRATLLNLDSLLHQGYVPYLHPLERITEPILEDGETPIDVINEIEEGWTFKDGVFRNENYKPNPNFWLTTSLPQWLIESLSSWHIDWQGLIPKGLALPIDPK